MVRFVVWMIVKHIRDSHEVGSRLIHKYVVNSCSCVTATICIAMALVKRRYKPIISFDYFRSVRAWPYGLDTVLHPTYSMCALKSPTITRGCE